ncbi:hypothetical protein M8J77_009826 [Diaphorina citri]|nr:hypothetical protein M8J77_009826 [Diaphorina citri]
MLKWCVGRQLTYASRRWEITVPSSILAALNGRVGVRGHYYYFTYLGGVVVKALAWSRLVMLTMEIIDSDISDALKLCPHSQPCRSTSTETVHYLDNIDSPLHLVERRGRLCVDTAFWAQIVSSLVITLVRSLVSSSLHTDSLLQ